MCHRSSYYREQVCVPVSVLVAALEKGQVLVLVGAPVSVLVLVLVGAPVSVLVLKPRYNMTAIVDCHLWLWMTH